MKYYPLTTIQNDDLLQMYTSFYPQSGQLPFFITLGEKIDPEDMKKAVNIEIERNDSLRLRFIRKGFKNYQYFIPEYTLEEIALDDFRGKTEDEMLRFLKSDASVPLKFRKGEVFRIRFFITPDERFGIYFCIMHLNMDISAIFIFFKDLINVYHSLKNNTELPPLDSFEAGIERDLSIFSNKQRAERNDRFFENYFRENGPDFYAGVDGMRELNKIRKFMFNSKARCCLGFDPFHDRSDTLKLHLDGELFEKMEKFCAEKHVSVQALIELGIRTHLSGINGYTDDVSLMVTINRRSTPADFNSGGSRALALPVRTVIEKSASFSDALIQQSLCQMKIFKHCDYSSKKCAFKNAKINHRILGTLSTSMLFTYFPKEFLALPEKVDLKFGGMGTGHFVCKLYTMVVPCFEDGGLDFYYEYQTHIITPDDLENMHSNMIKIIETGIENPDLSIEHILNEVL